MLWRHISLNSQGKFLRITWKRFIIRFYIGNRGTAWIQRCLKFVQIFLIFLLIALVLIVVLAAYFISRGNDGDEKNRRSYTVELVDVLDQNVDKVAVGDTVIDKVKNLDMGVVTDIEVLTSYDDTTGRGYYDSSTGSTGRIFFCHPHH